MLSLVSSEIPNKQKQISELLSDFFSSKEGHSVILNGKSIQSNAVRISCYI